jgi:hypothetical protein
MKAELSKCKACDLCNTVGQEVRIHLDPYTGEAAVIVCTDPVECEKNAEMGDRLDAMFGEYMAQQSFEAGQNPWAQ